MKALKLLLQLLLPVLLIVLGVSLFQKMKASRPAPKSKPSAVIVPRAEFLTIRPGTYAPPLQSYGTVESYDATTLTAQVQAQVIEISPSFRTGLQVKKGDPLIQLDPVAFRANVDTARAQVTIAESALAQEQVTAQQAADDWVASGRKLADASPLVLRQPQLASAQASVTAARADLQRAMQDLSHTSIVAPYDGVVSARSISLGNLATTSTPLGTILSTERVEIRLPLTAAQLAEWQRSGQSTLSLTSPSMPEVSWTATVRRTDPSIDAQNQVSYLIAEVDAPYAGETPLAVGTFLNAEIPTPALEDVYKVSGTALVNDAYIWTVSDDDTLQKVSVTRHRSYEGELYFTPTDPVTTDPLRIITRPLTTYRAGDAVNPIEL